MRYPSCEIVFTDVRKAEFLHSEINSPNVGQVLVRMEYTVVSGGGPNALAY